MGGCLEEARARVLLADDFEMFRRFVASTLRNRRGFEVVGEARDGLEAIELASKLQPDLILLDVALPKLNGFEAARQILRVSPGSKILFLSAEHSREVSQEALSMGASGYVVKWQAAHDLMPAVEAVLQGKQFVSDWLRGSNSV